MKKSGLIVLTGIAALLLGTASQTAQAAGCGGYVNVWVSGCAPWDNNPRRMPGAPGYVAPRPTVVSQPRPVVVQPPSGGSLISNNRGGVLSDNGLGARSGSGLISNNRGGLISDNGIGVRR